MSERTLADLVFLVLVVVSAGALLVRRGGGGALEERHALEASVKAAEERLAAGGVQGLEERAGRIATRLSRIAARVEGLERRSPPPREPARAAVAPPPVQRAASERIESWIRRGREAAAREALAGIDAIDAATRDALLEIYREELRGEDALFRKVSQGEIAGDAVAVRLEEVHAHRRERVREALGEERYRQLESALPDPPGIRMPIPQAGVPGDSKR